MRMEFTSPRTTALNQMLHSSPITTSPTTVQLSAKKQSFPNFGETPLTGFIKAILRIANVYQYFQFNTLFLKKVHVWLTVYHLLPLLLLILRLFAALRQLRISLRVGLHIIGIVACF